MELHKLNSHFLFKDNVDVVLFVEDCLNLSNEDPTLIILISREKSGEFCVGTATTELWVDTLISSYYEKLRTT